MMEYQEIEFNTGISDDTFEFTPPEGAKLVEYASYKFSFAQVSKRGDIERVESMI